MGLRVGRDIFGYEKSYETRSLKNITFLGLK